MTDPAPTPLTPPAATPAGAEAPPTTLPNVATHPYLTLARLERLVKTIDAKVAALWVHPAEYARLAADYTRTPDAQHSATVRCCGLRVEQDERLPRHYAEARDRTGAVVHRYAFAARP